MMQQDTPKTIYLNDYQPPDYWIDTVELDFDLGETTTTVQSRLTFRRNTEKSLATHPLILQGEELILQSVALNGETLPSQAYSQDAKTLTIPQVPETFLLEIETQIKPQENTALEGLYKSSGNFCTQCEAEGFRRITYFLDRPDVMARYTTTITADQYKYPILLSNGDLVEQKQLPNQRHLAKWEDPFKKPSYLFALVAGDLVCQEDTFVTQGGRTVALQVFVEKSNEDKCEHALRSLKKAMKWEEEVYGREYDLNTYMIVAVNDFNMGAMENKGLNIFNSKYVLAKPETATDWDYTAIEGVIAHEYFHNWTGNRITCRDWFQLSLKEGLTVFRDQSFSADMGSASVQRINDVRALRASQFIEDAGPMAHPVRPQSYVTINNFYTTTIYNKGAEVVRMIHQILGREGFRQGMDLYFERHDGQAVTTDDFVQCMEEANHTDLKQFRNWYNQAGTPEVEIQTQYDASQKRYTLSLKQRCNPTPNQPHKDPFHIPIALGLLDADGQDLPLRFIGETGEKTTRVLNLTQEEETFHFIDIPRQPVPSVLRGFSAPIKLKLEYTDEELAFLMGHDSDLFNRWEAGHQLAIKTLLNLIEDYQQQRELVLPAPLKEAFHRMLNDPHLDPALIAETLTLPSEGYLGELMTVIDVEAIHEVREFVRRVLATELQDSLMQTYQTNQESGPYRLDTQSRAKRQLKNTSLAYLMKLNDAPITQLCLGQFQTANNMTDMLGALNALALNDTFARKLALKEFYETWQHETLVVDKWFSIQALSPLPGTLEEVKQLTQHRAFDLKNPNKVRALIGVFCQANPFCFHHETGEGYEFLGDHVIALDHLNPQIAARLANGLSRWRKFDPQRQELMKHQLERILRVSNLSHDVYEIVSKSLALSPQ